MGCSSGFRTKTETGSGRTRDKGSDIVKKKLKRARRSVIGTLGWTSLILATGVNLPSAWATLLVAAALASMWVLCMWLAGVFEEAWG